MNATDRSLARLERAIANLHATVLLFQEITMASNQELVDKIAELRAGQTESRQDAAAARAVAEQVVGLLQALTAKIGELAAGGVQLVTQEQLNALVAQADAGIADMNAANAERDAAAAALAQAVTDNTPAVIPEPLPANPPV